MSVIVFYENLLTKKKSQNSGFLKSVNAWHLRAHRVGEAMLVLDVILDILVAVTTVDEGKKREKGSARARFILQGDRAINLYMPSSAEFPTFGKTRLLASLADQFA